MQWRKKLKTRKFVENELSGFVYEWTNIQIFLRFLNRFIAHASSTVEYAKNQIWTGDTRIFSPLLYQLSYPGSSLWIILVQGFNLCQLKRSKKVFLLVFRMIFIIFDLEVTNMIKMDCNWIISKWSNLCRSYITKSIDHMISLLTDQLNWS